MARSLKQVREEKGAARAALLKFREDVDAKAATEKRAAWTKEEDSAFAKISADFDTLAAEEARALKFEEIEKDARNVPGREDVKPGQGEHKGEVTDETRSRAIAGWFAEQSGEGATDEEIDAARSCRLNLRSRQLTIPMLRTGGFRKAQRTHRSVFGEGREAALRGIEARDLSVGNNVAGGYIAAPEEMVRSLEIAMLAFGGIYEQAQVIRTANANPLSWPSADDTSNSGEWLAEAADATATSESVDPTFKKTTWLAHKVSSKPIQVSFELLRDSIFDLPGIIGAMLGERIGRAKATAFATGSGAGRPRGLTLDTTAGKTAASATDITADELLELIHSVDTAYRAGSAFLMKDSTVLLLRKKKGGDGQYIWQAGMQAGAPSTLHGYPVITCQDMPAATAGLKSVVFGQLSAYKVREVGAIRLRRFDELYGETDQTGFIAFHEADGGLLDAGGHPVKHLIQA